MKKLAIATAALLLHVTNQAQTTNDVTNNVDKEIIQVHNKVYKALLEKQREIMNAALHHKFTFISADAVLMDKDKFIEGFAMNPEIRFAVLTSSDKKVVIVDKTAILTVVVHITISKGDKTRSMKERVTETYVQVSGGWTLLGMQATYIPN